MESHAKYSIVGFAIISLSVVVIVTLLWLSEYGVSSGFSYYSIDFQSQSLQGLQKDSYVTMKGIKVGDVRSLQISNKNIEQVRVLIRVDYGTPIKVDTQAVISRSLLTGYATIELTGSTKESPVLVAVPNGEAYPIIQEGKTDLDHIADSLPQLVDNIGNIVKDVDGFLSKDNQIAFSNILKNVEVFSETISNNRGKIETVVVNLEKLSNDFVEISASAREISKTADTTFKNINVQVGDILGGTAETIDEIDRKLVEVSLAIKSVSDVIVQQLSTISENVSEAAQSMSKTFEKLDDPRAILTGPDRNALGPGESLPER